jgi:hypothetical protein
MIEVPLAVCGHYSFTRVSRNCVEEKKERRVGYKEKRRWLNFLKKAVS